MIITFCGHSDQAGNEELKQKILALIKERSKGEEVTFYLGGYGWFDAFALQCCKEYKKEDPRARLVFVSPYLDETFFKRREYYLTSYDETVVADVENAFGKYSILKRNRWMVLKSDLLIACVDRGWGGAAKTLEFAVKRHKPYVNFGRKTFES